MQKSFAHVERYWFSATMLAKSQSLARVVAEKNQTCRKISLARVVAENLRPDMNICKFISLSIYIYIYMYICVCVLGINIWQGWMRKAQLDQSALLFVLPLG